MDQNDIIVEILKVIVDGEEKRNKMFEKALNTFWVTVLGVAFILSAANIVLFANMFVK